MPKVESALGSLPSKMLAGGPVHKSYQLSLQTFRANEMHSGMFDMSVDVSCLEEHIVFSKYLDKNIRIALYKRLVLLPENLVDNICVRRNHRPRAQNVGPKQWPVPGNIHTHANLRFKESD